MSNSNPSLQIDPADSGTLTGMMRTIMRKVLQSVDGMLPATVIAVDSKRQFVTVQPLIQVLGVDDSLTSRAQIAKVPLFSYGSGGFTLSFPVNPGDLGWIKASDRDISLYIQSNKESGPNTTRLHSFEDGLFVPDFARQWTLASEDNARAVLQNADASIKIAIGTDEIKIVHPTKIEVVCPLVTMSGDLTVTGTVTGKTDVVADTISGKTHTHSGVMTGGGDTGPPT